MPTLGDVRIHFHNESAEVFRVLKSKELPRLNRVAHLGLAAHVFAGVSHSRLEYVLLQCAVIGLLKKLTPNSGAFNLSSPVAVPGLKGKVSSGEELLKCWALLGNVGHPQYTYGVELPLLRLAAADRDFRTSLLRKIGSKRRAWAANVISERSDEDFHYILSYYRISHLLPDRSRLIAKFRAYLDALLLPLGSLQLTGEATLRLQSLRRTYAIVRHLCILAVDSHYSPFPVRLQLPSAVLGLASTSRYGSFEPAMNAFLYDTAASMAEVLYLSPSVMALQRNYERYAERKLQRYKALNLLGGEELNRRFGEWFADGFGMPKQDELVPFVRFSFGTWSRPVLGSQDVDSTRLGLERRVADGVISFANVVRNPFSFDMYVDFMIMGSASVPQRFGLASSIRIWLLRTIEAEVLLRLRRLLPTVRTPMDARRIRNHVERELKRMRRHLNQLCIATIESILPRAWGISCPALLNGLSDVQCAKYKVRWENFESINEIDNHISQQRAGGVDRAREHELRLYEEAINRSSADFAALIPYSVVVRDHYGQQKDEWDGALVEFSDSELLITIFEGKSGGNAGQRENEAFAQLAATKKMLQGGSGISIRRERWAGSGAVIRIRAQIQG